MRKIAAIKDLQEYMPNTSGGDIFDLPDDFNFDLLDDFNKEIMAGLPERPFQTTVDLIRGQGYPAEAHEVVTADGYILTLHRIPHGRRDSGTEEGERQVVHLQHGLLSSSSDWVMQPPERALAYMLADRGYDVWLGNARGNTYSRRHANMTDEQPEFWRFTWDQMGQYDCPAMIDYILDTTGQRDLYWVGHSMGTTMFWALMNYHPEYNSKVRLMQALGPVAQVRNARSVIRHFAKPQIIQLFSLLFGEGQFLPQDGIVLALAGDVCEHNRIERTCEKTWVRIAFTVGGINSGQFNMTSLPVLISHVPAGASTRTVAHYAQEIQEKAFMRFDWGWRENMERYGQLTPPLYSLEPVTTPVALFWSDNDLLADPRDVLWLAEQLPDLVQNNRVPLKAFSHLDFLWAKDADKLLYDHVIDNLEKY